MGLEAHHQEVIENHQRSYPIKVAALARDLGLAVREVDMADDVSGSLKKEGDSWIIRVNRRHAKVRQRFTVAHEIAHFLLHRDKISQGLTDDTFYRSSLSDNVEREANRLAADILMPWHLVRLAAERGARDPQSLASEFGVSEAAMAIRLGLPA